MKVPFALSAAPSVVLGLPAKLNKNVYAERHESDPDRPWVLLETPGTKVWEAFDDGLRGIWQTDGHAGGKILIAAGDTIELFDPATNALASPMTGTIAGTDKGDLAFTEAEGFGLFNGQLYVSSGTAIAAVTDPDFAALLAFAGVSSFSSVTTIGQRGIFSFGSQFGFTEVSDLDNTTALSYYTPESSPDAIVAVKHFLVMKSYRPSTLVPGAAFALPSIVRSRAARSPAAGSMFRIPFDAFWSASIV